MEFLRRRPFIRGFFGDEKYRGKWHTQTQKEVIGSTIIIFPHENYWVVEVGDTRGELVATYNTMSCEVLPNEYKFSSYVKMFDDTQHLIEYSTKHGVVFLLVEKEKKESPPPEFKYICFECVEEAI